MNRPDNPNLNNRNPSNPNALLEQVRTVIRLKHLSFRTEDSYLSTIRRFIIFHGKRHPAALGPDAIRDYLTHLAVEEHVAASTQNVARNAILFLYREVLGIPLPPLVGVAPARRPERLPVVFTRIEVRAILGVLDGTPHLMASLLYGAGLRLMECLRLFTPLQSAANRGGSKTLISKCTRSPFETAKGRRIASPCSPGGWKRRWSSI